MDQNRNGWGAAVNRTGSSAQADGESASPSGSPLHGRMLQVSRLATIGEMAAGIAHELNQPLTAIANYAQACDRLLGRSSAELEDVRAALREIAAQAVRAGDILHRLRSLARSPLMRRERANLNVAVEAMRDLILADARVHRAQVHFQLDQRLPPVAIDTTQIQHTILNLIHNALEAPVGPQAEARELTLRTGLAAEGEVEVAILDNGPGLSPQAAERLFDPFFSTKPDGSGLGLAISNTIIRAHGGTLGHRPNRPQGACFFIRLSAESLENGATCE